MSAFRAHVSAIQEHASAFCDREFALTVASITSQTIVTIAAGCLVVAVKVAGRIVVTVGAPL